MANKEIKKANENSVLVREELEVVTSVIAVLFLAVTIVVYVFGTPMQTNRACLEMLDVYKIMDSFEDIDIIVVNQGLFKFHRRINPEIFQEVLGLTKPFNDGLTGNEGVTRNLHDELMRLDYYIGENKIFSVNSFHAIAEFDDNARNNRILRLGEYRALAVIDNGGFR